MCAVFFGVGGQRSIVFGGARLLVRRKKGRAIEMERNEAAPCRGAVPSVPRTHVPRVPAKGHIECRIPPNDSLYQLVLSLSLAGSPARDTPHFKNIRPPPDGNRTTEKSVDVALVGGPVLLYLDGTKCCLMARGKDKGIPLCWVSLSWKTTGTNVLLLCASIHPAGCHPTLVLYCWVGPWGGGHRPESDTLFW